MNERDERHLFLVIAFTVVFFATVPIHEMGHVAISILLGNEDAIIEVVYFEINIKGILDSSFGHVKYDRNKMELSNYQGYVEILYETVWILVLILPLDKIFGTNIFFTYRQREKSIDVFR